MRRPSAKVFFKKIKKFICRGLALGKQIKKKPFICRRRQWSPPSTRDEVLEEEHMTAMASSSSEDERGQQTGEGDEVLEGEGGEALEGEGEGSATRTLYE